MSVRITADDIMLLHEEVRHASPGAVTRGRIDRQAIAGIIDATFMVMYGQPVHGTVFQQAASLMEHIIRLHPFRDGNKRTALLAAYTFLEINGRYTVMPLDTVRFVMGVADDRSRAEDDVKRLNSHIAEWLEARAAADYTGYQKLTDRYVTEPIEDMIRMSRTKGGRALAESRLKRWLAGDAHPGDITGGQRVEDFLHSVASAAARRPPRREASGL